MIKLKQILMESYETDTEEFLKFAKITWDEVKTANTFEDLYKLVAARNKKIKLPAGESGQGDNFFEVGPGGATHLSTLIYTNMLQDIYNSIHKD